MDTNERSNTAGQPGYPGGEKKRGEQIRESARQAGEAIRSGARSTAEEARERAGNAARKIKEESAGVINQQKERAAEKMSHLSSTLHETADRLEREQNPNIAHYTHRLADQIERTTGYVRQTDLDGMLRDAQDLARRNPEYVLGGMFIAGLLIARFLKASSHAAESEHESSYGGAESATHQRQFRQSYAGMPEAGQGTNLNVGSQSPSTEPFAEGRPSIQP